MAKFTGTVCDNCEQPVPKGITSWKIRGVLKPKQGEKIIEAPEGHPEGAELPAREAKVATLDFCDACAGELFGDAVKEYKPRPRKAKGDAPVKKTTAAKPAA